jgi:hypothetical protein
MVAKICAYRHALRAGLQRFGGMADWLRARADLQCADDRSRDFLIHLG